MRPQPAASFGAAAPPSIALGAPPQQAAQLGAHLQAMQARQQVRSG